MKYVQNFDFWNLFCPTVMILTDFHTYLLIVTQNSTGTNKFLNIKEDFENTFQNDVLIIEVDQWKWLRNMWWTMSVLSVSNKTYLQILNWTLIENLNQTPFCDVVCYSLREGSMWLGWACHHVKYNRWGRRRIPLLLQKTRWWLKSYLKGLCCWI